MRYSVYFSQDEHGVTNYLVTVEVLVGEPNAQGGVSQEPEGPNRDGPGPQDPPNGQQSFLVPVPEAVNGTNGANPEGDSDGGSTHSSISPPPEVLAAPPVPSDLHLRSPLADLNGRTPPAHRAPTTVPETHHDQENPAAAGPQPPLC